MAHALSQDGRAYVETSNLDGESNLKLKESPTGTLKIHDEQGLSKLHGVAYVRDGEGQ